MIEFRQKDFSILGWTSGMAGVGATVGAGASWLRAGGKNSHASETFTGMAIGAALGFLAGCIDEGRERFNRKKTVDARLMKTVVENLKKDNFKEGYHFTLDPKTASELKTRVCICISKISGDLRILVNIVSDPKLKGIATDMIKNIPNKSAVSERNSDRFNDITITTISDSSMDAGLITGIAERFIHSGYPVQLVEVG